MTELNCNIIPKSPLNNRNLPYDNEVEELKLIIEVHGKQHYWENCSWYKHLAKRNGITAKEEFNRRTWYDEYKEKYGDIEKAKIVSYWKNNTEQIAYCGFSCNHCFLGKWCGGCRSNFNVCSYSTCFNAGNCPNAMCAKEKKIDGCYNCSEILSCNVGFYGSGNDSIACKAQAIFIAKHGKEALINILNELHKNYDFKKIQEILGVDLEKALEILESEYIKLQK